MDPQNQMPRSCAVEVREGLELGEYANAFRVLEDGSDCLLDFLVRSETEGKAVVVARLRVRRGFLPALRDRLTESLQQVPVDQSVVFPVGEDASQLPH